MGKRIILVTATFPYIGGEQFLETEVKYYKTIKNVELSIMPLVRISTEQREIDKEIKIDNLFILTRQRKLYYIIQSFLNNELYTFFFKECIQDIRRGGVFFKSFVKYQRYYDILEEFLSNYDNPKDLVFYTYWNTEVTYALQSLKKKYTYKLISRIHGYDIYQERYPYNYLPLKKQFTKNIDTIYTITSSAKKYLIDTHKFSEEQVTVSRLGVIDYNIVTLPNEKKILHLLSCSYILAVKELNKIITSLEYLGKYHPELQFKWTHIGNGKLFDELYINATDTLYKYTNIQFEFLGHLDNTDIYKYYKNNKIDVFINVSSSEGVPVSIMEAMSCHIPIIAPNIGGISDMIQNNYNGKLMKKEVSINEIVTSLIDTEFYKQQLVRDRAYKVFLEKYNANINYIGFIKDVLDEK